MSSLVKDAPSKKVICEYCDSYFVFTEDELKEHLTHVHFICLLCKNTPNPKYDSELSLVKHMWAKHPAAFMDWTPP
uniref:Uncharacterized protein n=1 Tax=viral metagenome TaxID=1070528 RepID=A0A6C0HGI5_9ZZZZ